MDTAIVRFRPKDMEMLSFPCSNARLEVVVGVDSVNRGVEYRNDM